MDKNEKNTSLFLQKPYACILAINKSFVIQKSPWE